MKEIGKNEKLLSNLLGRNCLLDSSVKEVRIFNSEEVKVEIFFNMRQDSDFKRVLLRFVGVREYCFYHTEQYIFYNVEQYKFMYDETYKFYLSLDPYEEDQRISEKDQDYIFANEVVGYSIQNPK